MKPVMITIGWIGICMLWACGATPDYSANEVIMYSQTDCNYCKEKRELLLEKGVPFEEFFIDTSSVARMTMYRKLQVAGISKKSVGTPVIEVNGVIMPGNPSFEKIEGHLFTQPATP